MSQFRWGVVGCGHAARKFCTGVAAIPDHSIAAIASRSLEKASLLGEQFVCCTAFGRYDDLISYGDVDAVYIATPASLHFGSACRAIEAGIPVLCEKPMSVFGGEVESMISLARERNVFLMEAQWNRFTPLFRQVTKMIKQTQIGVVEGLTATFGKSLNPAKHQRLFDLELGGGALFDIGIYPVSISHAVFGESPISVRLLDVVFSHGVDSSFSAELQFSGGRKACIVASIGKQLPGMAGVHGTHGTIRIPKFWQSETAVLERTDSDPQEIHEPFLANGMEYQAIHVQDCVSDGLSESPILPLSESMEICHTLCRIRENWLTSSTLHDRAIED